MTPSERMIVVGLNHLNASVSSREKAVVPPQDLPRILKQLKTSASLDEVVILSTCSRVEVYAVCADPSRGHENLRAWFTQRAGAEIETALYAREGADAIRHLFRVASGLDSWIIGETEILAQVKKAYQSALAGGFARRTLNRAFQSAIAAGKDVRSATGIQNGIHSIGGATAMMAKRIFGDEAGGEILVVGAGQTAEAVVRHLAAKKFDRIVVANRTLDNARAIAAKLGGAAATLDEGLALLERVEVAVFSASVTEPLLSAEALARALARRRKPLFLVDLGVPRNVEPACAKLDSVYLYDLDDLKRMIRGSMEGKFAEKGRAEEQAEAAAQDCRRELDKPHSHQGDKMCTRTGRGIPPARLVLSVILACAFQTRALAAEPEAAKEIVPALSASVTAADRAAEHAGAESCLTCHADREDFKQNIHAKVWSAAKGIESSKSCETCHGPGSRHAAEGDVSAIFNPGKADGDKASETCLTCHSADRSRMFWAGSAHAGKGESCVSCHKVHSGNESLLKKKTETELCLTCHKDVKADLAKRSKHPLRDTTSKSGAGKMTCSSCHNPHGSRSEKLIAAKSINDKCFECHTEKQAAVLWEHAPVKEDCMTCHSPHGSSNNKLLTQKVPRLCQSCHMQGRHQSGTLATNSAFAANRSCLNCHAMVHGSNHPSGAVLQR